MSENMVWWYEAKWHQKLRWHWFAFTMVKRFRVRYRIGHPPTVRWSTLLSYDEANRLANIFDGRVCMLDGEE